MRCEGILMRSVQEISVTLKGGRESITVYRECQYSDGSVGASTAKLCFEQQTKVTYKTCELARATIRKTA